MVASDSQGEDERRREGMKLLLEAHDLTLQIAEDMAHELFRYGSPTAKQAREKLAQARALVAQIRASIERTG